jgi:hypothetical protein
MSNDYMLERLKQKFLKTNPVSTSTIKSIKGGAQNDPLNTNYLDPNSTNPNAPSSSTVQNSNLEKDDPNSNDSNTYLNIEVYNPISNPTSVPIQAVSNITQASPILDNPSEFKLAIMRFSIPANLPLFIYPEDALAQQIYRVELYDLVSGLSVIQPLIYVDDCDLCFYTRGVYFYQHMLSFVNTALKACYTQMLVLNPSFVIPATDAIRVRYEPTTELFYLSFPQANANLYFNNTLQIRFSSELYIGFFPSFVSRGLFLQYPTHLPLQIVMDEVQNILVGTQYSIYTESPCVALWSQLQKLLITSNSIPINPEVISSSNQQSRNVLLDFEITPTISSTIPYQYNATILRWVDLISSQPLSQLEIAVLVQYRNGSVFPLYIQKNESLTIKFIIRSKTSWLRN